MPANRNALLRYRTIDRCLRNTARRWTLDDLIAAVSDALYDFEGRQVDVSRRTVQLDLQHMRSDRLGYRAPIEVYERKYYRYSDPAFKLTDSPLSEQDVSKLREATEMLRQFSGFRQMQAFTGVVGRLRDQLGAGRTDGRRIIDFEHNEHLRGLHYVDELYELIVANRRIFIDYQSFKAREARRMDFEPYFLKESRNRYFVLGRERGRERVMILALDRIQHIEAQDETFEHRPGLDIETFFQHTVGVSVTDAPPERVVLRIDREQAPYLLTKPIHASQEVIAQTTAHVDVALHVQISFELEKEILGYGSAIQVLEPTGFRRKLRSVFTEGVEAYERPTSPAEWEGLAQQFYERGFVNLGQLFTGRQRVKLGRQLRFLIRDLAGRSVRHDILPQLSPRLGAEPLTKRQRILGDVVRQLGQDLFHEEDWTPKHVDLCSATLDADHPYAPMPERRLVIAYSRWLAGPGCVECLRGSHRAPSASAAAELFTMASFGTPILGDFGQAILIETGTWWRFSGMKGRTVHWLEVGF